LEEILKKAGFEIAFSDVEKGFVTIIARKT